MDEQSIFALALEKTSTLERDAFLDEVCAGDPELRAGIEALLRAHEKPDSFLEAGGVNLPRTIDTPTVTERPGTMIGPYKLLEQIGEGGMGLVFVAEQQHPVRRKVALKLIKPGMDSRQVIARFEAERQALALMNHPNIAKVFDGGTTDGEPGGVSPGRPYFVMELVKGTPITNFCDHNKLDTRQRLELFLEVCQAVQHAHQKGIIHRDLKPSNILVEVHDVRPVVKIIDFGIAKALDQQLSDKTLYTGIAQMIGTPLYMSPEQAGLSSLDVDTRSDVYALGVLLYELLTGSTPFDGEALKKAGYDEMRRIIREDEPAKPSARLSTLHHQVLSTIAEQRGIEPRKLGQQMRGDLDWIVMKALEKDRNRRYESASALAADVHRYLADEPVLACPPSRRYRLGKFLRKHRTGVLTATALLVAVFVLAGTAGWWINDRLRREGETFRAVSAALQEADRLQEEGKLPDALAKVKQASEILISGASTFTLEQRVEARGVDLKMVADLEEIRAQRASKIKLVGFSTSCAFDPAQADQSYARTFRAYGVDVESLSPEDAARNIQERSVAVELAAALDDWSAMAKKTRPTGDEYWKRLLVIARTADPDPMRNKLREALEKNNGAALKDLVASIQAENLTAATVVTFANALDEKDAADEAVHLLRQARLRHPTDFWINYLLAHALERQKQPELEEAIRFYTAALISRPDFAKAHDALGLALKEKGRLDEAIAAFREAIRHNPAFAAFHLNLSNTLRKKGSVDEAFAEVQEAIRLKSDYPCAHIYLGIILTDKRRFDEAIVAFQEAIRLKSDWPNPYYYLGTALRANKKPDQAVAAYRQALSRQPDDVNALWDLCETLESQGKVVDAVESCREVIKSQPSFAVGHWALGWALWKHGKLNEAVDAFREAFRLKLKDARAYVDFGFLLDDKKDHDGAIDAFQEAVHLTPDFPIAYCNLGNALAKRGKLDEAIKVFREATRRFPNIFMAHYDLGRALQLNNQLEAAITAFKKAIELDPKNAEAFNHLGNALVAQKDLGGAIYARNKAIELDPKNAEAYFGLGIALYDKKDKDLAGAITAFKKAIELDPKNAKVYNNLGFALREQNDLAGAISAIKKAIELDPKYVKAYVHLGLALQDQKDLAGAITAYKKAIELKSDFPPAYWYLGLILLEHGQFADALVFLKKGNAVASQTSVRFPFAEYVRNAELFLRLEPKLPKVLSGETKPADTAECIGLAKLCQHRSQQFFVASVRFYGEAFVADSKLTNHYPYRYDAACAAALAGCGQGKDAANLDDGEYARLRKQSLAWLRAELDAWRLKLDKNLQKDRTAVGNKMQFWRHDTDFNGVRSPDALAKLAEAERRNWQALWEEVAALEKRCLLSAGAIDRTFGNGGLVSGPPLLFSVGNLVPRPNSGAFAVVVQTDGKIVAGGAGANGNQPGGQVLERFNANGTLDSSFGSGGVVRTQVGAGPSNILALALQRDGKIVAVGHALHSVSRYNSNGSLDKTFGQGGIVQIGTINGGSAVVVQGDGKIVVAGGGFGLARFNANGSLDNTFGSRQNPGIIVKPAFGGPNGLAIQPDGKILLVGNTGAAMAVARYTMTGQLDSSFGSSGTVTMAPAGTTASARSVVVLGNGDIVVAGSSAAGTPLTSMTLARLTSTGQLDTTFGGSNTGFAINSNIMISRDITQAANGDLVVAGTTLRKLTGSVSFGVAAFLPSGLPDTTFGTGGTTTANFAGGFVNVYGMAIQGDGKIVVVGSASMGSGTGVTFGLARFLPPDAKIGSFTDSSTGGNVQVPAAK